MPVDQQRQEQDFREFITKLLRAQKYEFLIEHSLFSRETLRRTMTELCDIIAREVNAYSCTIHLKLYDPVEFFPSRKEPPILDLSKHIERTALRWEMTEIGEPETIQGSPERQETEENAGNEENNEEEQIFSDWQRKVMTSTLAFPYWQYPKGVAYLVAANQEGPWQSLLATNKEDPFYERKLKARFVSLDTGITSDIFQDNFAKVRDPLSIRSSRRLRKLGQADYMVWRNNSWPGSFKNFYGSPIRIHPAGEVIGILKVENKQNINDEIRDGLNSNGKQNDIDQKEIDKILEESTLQSDPNDQALTILEARILSYAEKKESTGEYRRASLLALAYLVTDLRRATEQGSTGSLASLIYVPYPHGPKGIPRPEAQWKNLEDCVANAPVVQIMTKNIGDEIKLRDMLLSVGADPNSIKIAYPAVKKFYDWLSRCFQNLDYNNPTITADTNEWQIEIAAVRSWQNMPTGTSDMFLAHFHFEITLNTKRIGTKNGNSITLYAFVPPGKKQVFEISGNSLDPERPRCSQTLCEIYQELSSIPADRDPLTSIHLPASYRPARNGEWISLEMNGVDDQPDHLHFVIDLLVDRWVARIEALNYCLPVKEFSADDTKKLCWAALEIGKLIEREISYRANRSDDPIPLTAMEFYRIPISDLCFVDDIQRRRAETEQVKIHIEHHINNTLYTVEMQDAIRFKSRIKEHRSHLGRLGERHEGFVRGNLAIWFYLLSLRTAQLKSTGDFLARLAEFGGLVNQATGQPVDPFAPSLRLSPRDIDFFQQHGNAVVGDTRFVSPPCMEFRSSSQSEIGGLWQRLLNNLANEGFIKLQRDPLTRGYARPAGKSLGDLILRHYDSYAIAATSLLCQLLNLEMFQRVDVKKEPYCYLDFYDKCFHLRNFLARSAREIEDTPKFNALKQVFDKCWDHLLEYVETHDTKEFLKLLPPNLTGDRDDSCLSPGGIYKRIRNLNHTLWQQRAPAHLEWDLGRFDLLGCQLNCLYKNQVFAAYEQLWNSGDPFWGMITERKGRERMTESEFIQDRLRGRQRWLCLRTNYFEGDYYALQIAALVDPNAIHEGFWEKRGYNLRHVQYLLGRLFDKFDKAGAGKYKSLARVRHHLRWEYVDWYKAAVEIVRTKSATPRPHDDSVGFGSFLGEAAVDYLMERIDEYRKMKQVHEDLESLNAPAANRIELVSLREQVIAIWDALRKPLVEILRCGQVYTEKVLDSLTRLGNEELPFEIGGDAKLSVTHFSQQAENLYTALSGADGYEEGDAQRRLRIIDKEWNHFKGCFCLQENSKNGSINSASPIIFIQDAQLVENLYTVSLAPDSFACDRRADDASIGAGRHSPNAPHLRREQDDFDTRISRLYANLASLRREQKGFLFYRRAHGTEDRPGLSLRDTENVFHRIQNYVLLYDRQDNPELRSLRHSNTTEDEVAGLLRGWTSYGLFYYLRSLIPLEIQVRTMLADTLAEQYHDVVYKGAPPKGTEFPRRLMEKIAGELDDLDKEMEIDFEDYINRRRQAGE